MKDIKDLLTDHSFFKGLDDEYLELLAGCGKNVQRKAGEYLFHEGESADVFFLIRSGRVSLELATPGKSHLVIETLGEGEVVGWSWIFPPHVWTNDCRCLEDTRLTSLDGKCLRKKCEEDPRLGMAFMERFALVMASRLKAMRLQVLNLYGNGNGK